MVVGFESVPDGWLMNNRNKVKGKRRRETLNEKKKKKKKKINSERKESNLRVLMKKKG